MATKSYKVRLDFRKSQPIVDGERFQTRDREVQTVQQWLDDTREAFNAGVDYLTWWLLRMHRGAGVWREKRDGIWREWQEITTLNQLEEARSRHKTDPDSFALLENRELLDAFTSNGKTEAETVELAECCRRIAKELCPPSEDSSGAQMPRDSLDLLLNPHSDARGVRFNKTRFHWQLVDIARAVTNEQHFKCKSANLIREHDTNEHDKLRRWSDDIWMKAKQRANSSGWSDIVESLVQQAPKPEWLRNEAIAEQARTANSLRDLLDELGSNSLFAEDAGKKQLVKLKKRSETKQKQDSLGWPELRDAIIEEASSKSHDFHRLAEAACLPLPGFGDYHSDKDVSLGELRLKDVSSEWKRSMWTMAGQRVRSHLGWNRRRAGERMLWELRTTLFERGGWIRTKRNGKTIRKDELTPDDIRFEAPRHEEGHDYEQRPEYSSSEWVIALRQYETDEMPTHLEGVAFGAAEQLRIRKRTAKGWARVRDKWIEIIDKANNVGNPVPSADDLLEAFDQMRSRKTRDFGDRRLFEWLAAAERRWLWDGTNGDKDNDCGREDRDCVAAFIAHNEDLADKPDSITFTRSDPVKHPVWPFFGENSAVEYWLTRERTTNGDSRLVLVLKQLLERQADGSYSAVDRVKIALRGYEDFEKSFAIPNDAGDVSAKQSLVFRDDLLSGETRQGTLSGMKLTWERDELEAFHRKRKPSKTPPRIYANFSCDAGEPALPDWLTEHVGSDVKLKKPRDGMTRAFFLKRTISKDAATEDGVMRLSPGERRWPKEAITNGFTVRGTDLGYRTSSAGAWWRLSFTKPNGKVAWEVGTCDGESVYAVLERTATVSLPGDGETLPSDEQKLRDRLRSLRTRLNLNNALLRISRLLALQAVTQRKPNGDKKRKRPDGTTKRVGTRWIIETRSLSAEEIKQNCRKAAEQLVRRASTDAMVQSLKEIDHDGSLWDWLGSHDNGLKRLGELVPTTNVPTEKEARERSINRDALKANRKEEEDAFAHAVHELRSSLAKALCDGYEAKKRRRATSGLWFEFDAALLRDLSYGDRKKRKAQRTTFQGGLFRLLRKPPVTKHRDRKDKANNLPHGRTHRGGLSMSRLNFLDDVKNFVRRWSCRPRWPGDVRRVPEDAKFDRCDTEHLDNLREHRAKLIAHADVAQTLGFEQDLRRGVWLYKSTASPKDEIWHRPERRHLYQWRDSMLVKSSEDAPTHPIPAHSPAHLLVYEDLTRYKMSSDRPKNENAGLARWSHRRILAFAQHIGGLFGVPVTTVDARFSSRYCSHCGAPGCRAMKSVANNASTKIAQTPDAFRREEDRPWVLRDGGTHFVCANASCPVHLTPIDADENAAANIGLRFLRGVDGFRVTIGATGKVTKSIGYVPPELILTQANDANANTPGREPFWQSAEGGDALVGTAGGGRRNRKESAPAVDAEDDDESGSSRILYRDPSGGFRCRDRWFEGKVYWAAVARSCAAGIKAENASYFGLADED